MLTLYANWLRLVLQQPLNSTLLLNKLQVIFTKHVSHFIGTGFEKCWIFKVAYLGSGTYF